MIATRIANRLRRDERGYTLVELMTVLVILGTVVGALTGVFVSASSAEIEMNKRFQAQQDARMSLDRLRRETHCASSITPAGPATTVTLNLPAQCKVATGLVSWCALPVGSSTTRFRLYRSVASPCGDAVDRVYADYLTSQDVFNHTVQSSASLGKLAVTLPVDLDPAKQGQYRLEDTLVMRNTTRTCISGSPNPPCS